MENEILEITTERMSNGPAAVGRHEGIVVFVHGAAPGERVRARILEKKKNFWVATVTKILQPSPDRVTPPCRVFGFEDHHCGGCDWQHLSYTAQVREKENALLFEIHKATRLPLDELKPLLKTYPAASTFNYRARAQVRESEKGVGFYSRGTHELVPAENCMILKPALQEHWKAQRKKTRPKEETKSEWAWNEKTGVQVLEEESENVFSQINPEQNEVLREIVSNAVKAHSLKHERLYDLYAGDGNLSHALVPLFKEILCVESHIPEDAPSDRLWTERTMEKFFSEFKVKPGSEPDVVIVDPPRNGLSQAIKVKDLGAELLVYVSCNPATLARDLKTLLEGYSFLELHCLDFFPQTHHIESVSILKKK